MMGWLRRSSTPKTEQRASSAEGEDKNKLQDENNIYEDGEVLVGEPKNILLSIISQLRPGMDLSRVTLPVFILETKSFLEKLTDFMTHPDLLIGLRLETPEERLKAIVRFYLSGFYIRPKGVKKPYTPQLGETFRCHWNHTGSKSFYVSEQVSHGPDISAFYGSNRAEGFVVNGSITFRDKFLGNSTSVTLEGEGHLHLLYYDEIYTFTFPVVYARGLLWGTLVMELGGDISVKCVKSGYRADIEFKVKGFFGGEYNLISGKISKGEVDEAGNWDKKLQHLYAIDGKWDGIIKIKDLRTKEESVYWDPNAGMAPKSKMHVRPLEEQSEWDSRRFWHQVTLGLRANDTDRATDEKLKIDEMMKRLAEEREEKGINYEPKLFRQEEDGTWVYKYFDLTKWSDKEREELEEYEEDGIIASRRKASETEKKKKKKKKKKAAEDKGEKEDGEGAKEKPEGEAV